LKIQTGYLYHIKDSFFDKINNEKLMLNHENGHSRPSYLAIRDEKILWFIPLSTRVDKYKSIIEKKVKKYGKCRTIIIRKIGGVNQAILIQNAFPTTEKYVQNIHTIDGKIVKVPSAVKKEVLSNFKYMLSLKANGLNLFFADIDGIKDILLNELKDECK